MTLSGQGYICSAGETFDIIALSVYGDEKYAAELLCANPEYSCTPVFTGGETLYLPVVEIASDGNNNQSMSIIAPWKE